MTLGRRLAPAAAGAQEAPARTDQHGWFLAITEALQNDAVELAVQPIVDLERGVIVGYEALARFSGIPVGPDVWFATAGRVGLGRALEAHAFASALRLRVELPQNCFLSVNLSPAALTSPEVTSVVAQTGSFEGVVIELTEHDAIADYLELRVVLDDLRARGAKIAVDDAGSGYAGLQWITALRPDLVKVDRELVADLDRDPTKMAMVEMLGSLSGQLDAWVLAEGVERPEELDALIRLGVPLAQGYLLAKPSLERWPSLPVALSDRIRRRGQHRRGETLESILETPDAAHSRAAAIAALRAAPAGEIIVAVDERHRPTGLHTSAEPRSALPAMTAKVDERITEIGRRCLTRPHSQRWLPVVCVDGLGRYVGIVRPERVMSHLLDTTERHP